MSPTSMPFLDGFCRGLAAGLLVLALVLAGSAHAEQWQRAVIVDSPAITVTVATRGEIARLRASHPMLKHSAAELAKVRWLYGFSILYRDKLTGAYRCDLYVSSLEDVATIEHETKHCNGWVHP